MQPFAINGTRLTLIATILIGALTTPFSLIFSSHESPLPYQTHHFISFIVPVYNRAQLVTKALDSIYNQGLDPDTFEIICIDDGSADNTYYTLLKYQQTKKNMIVLRHENNRGAAVARNTGIAIAKGDLIFPLDSDNALVPNSILLLINLLDSSGSDAAAFEEIRYVYPDNSSTRSHFSSPPGGILNIHTIFSPHHLALGSGNYLYTRDSYNRAGGYQSYAIETLSFGIMQIATGSTIAVLPSSYYLHGLSSDSKWITDQEKGLNTRTLICLLAQLDEIFTTQTIQFIARLPLDYQDIYTDFSLFELRPQQALKFLFAAYRLDHAHNLTAARDAYQKAILLGCNHQKTIARLERINHIIAHSEQ